jgi:hypothetical protein
MVTQPRKRYCCPQTRQDKRRLCSEVVGATRSHENSGDQARNILVFAIAWNVVIFANQKLRFAQKHIRFVWVLFRVLLQFG